MSSLAEAEPPSLGRFLLLATSVNDVNLHAIFTHRGDHATPSSKSALPYPWIGSNMDMPLRAFRDYKDVQQQLMLDSSCSNPSHATLSESE
jgi:hypothetical protein